MKTGVKVCDAMTQRPVTLLSSVSAAECGRMMAEEHVGSILVKDGNHFGIVTEQDLVRKVLAQGFDPKTIELKEIMSAQMYTIGPEKDIHEALELMAEKNVRHLPVVADGAMVGFITSKDILKLQPQLFEILADKIELKEYERKLSS